MWWRGGFGGKGGRESCAVQEMDAQCLYIQEDCSGSFCLPLHCCLSSILPEMEVWILCPEFCPGMKYAETLSSVIQRRDGPCLHSVPDSLSNFQCRGLKSEICSPQGPVIVSTCAWVSPWLRVSPNEIWAHMETCILRDLLMHERNVRAKAHVLMVSSSPSRRHEQQRKCCNISSPIIAQRSAVSSSTFSSAKTRSSFFSLLPSEQGWPPFLFVAFSCRLYSTCSRLQAVRLRPWEKDHRAPFSSDSGLEKTCPFVPFAISNEWGRQDRDAVYHMLKVPRHLVCPFVTRDTLVASNPLIVDSAHVLHVYDNLMHTLNLSMLVVVLHFRTAL